MRCVLARRIKWVAVLGTFLLLGLTVDRGYAQQVQIEIGKQQDQEQARPDSPRFVPEMLEKYKNEIAEAAKKVHQAAEKGDLKELQKALQEMETAMNKARNLADPLTPIVPRVIINGQEIKPGDPRFPRIRIIPGRQPGAIIPAIPAQPVKPQEQKPQEEKKDGQSEKKGEKSDQACREACGLKWHTQLAAALKEAQNTGKPVFVFHTLGDLFDKL